MQSPECSNLCDASSIQCFVSQKEHEGPVVSGHFGSCLIADQTIVFRAAMLGKIEHGFFVFLGQVEIAVGGDEFVAVR